jgi:hypothetical protein
MTTVIVTPGTVANGTVTVSKTGATGTFKASEEIEIASGKFFLKAEPASGYKFDGWKVAGASAVTKTDNPVEIAVAANGSYTMLTPVFSLIPVPTGRTVYLKPTGGVNWLQVGDGKTPRFAVWACESTAGKTDRWYDMVKVSNNLYSVTIDESYAKVVFVRFNGNGTENNWNSGNKYNQSGDLYVSKGNCFSPDGWDNSTTKWTTYTP